MHTFTVLHLWQEEEYFQHETFMQSESLEQTIAPPCLTIEKRNFVVEAVNFLLIRV